MNTKTNQRYQKTEQQIIETFLDLLRRMPLKQIHVRTLCDACGLNRSSFYLHFQDLSDLMQKAELVLIRNAEHLASSGTASESEEARFARYFAFIQQYQGFFRTYLNAVPQSRFLDSLVPNAQEEGSESRSACYHRAFFQAGLTALVRTWLDAGCPESPEVLSAFLFQEFSL